MSHYPSSAELAEMRGYRGVPRPTYGAMPWERGYGIPTVEACQRDFSWDPATHSLARWGADDARSRAFAYGGAEYGSWHPHNVAAFDHERALGIPFQWAPIVGSLVLSSVSCYHCDQSDRHLPTCEWNVNR